MVSPSSNVENDLVIFALYAMTVGIVIVKSLAGDIPSRIVPSKVITSPSSNPLEKPSLPFSTRSVKVIV